MPDLKAGSKVDDLDTPPTVGDYSDVTLETVTTSGYVITVSSGVYEDCGAVFIAPTSGRVAIHHRAQAANSSSWTALSPVVRAGGVIGSGTVFLAGAEATALISSVSTPFAAGVTNFVEGLTPGSTYNVRIEHRVGGGTGSFLRRSIVVEPLP